MSKSSNLSWDERKEIIASYVVDNTESEFHVCFENDDAGKHLSLYLPDSARKSFKIKAFREYTYKKVGFSRVTLTFVPENYIEHFLR